MPTVGAATGPATMFIRRWEATRTDTVLFSPWCHPWTRRAARQQPLPPMNMWISCFSTWFLALQHGSRLGRECSIGIESGAAGHLRGGDLATTRPTTWSTGPGEVGARQCWALDISRRGTDYRPRRGVTTGCDGDRSFYDRRFYWSVAATTVAVPAPPTVTPRRELLRENLRSAHTHNNQR